MDDLKSATKNAIHDKNSGLEMAVTRIEAVLKEYEREANVELNVEEIKVAKAKIDELDKGIRELKNELVGGEEAINANYNAKLNAKELELSNLKLKLTREHQEKVANSPTILSTTKSMRNVKLYQDFVTARATSTKKSTR